MSLHNLLICCGPVPEGGTPGCDGCKPRCWCGGEWGARYPGDESGQGCLEDINHGSGTRVLPPGTHT